MSPKQNIVRDFLRMNHTITIKQAVELIGQDIYTNREFHVGNILRRMVKRRLLEKEKRGVYRLPAIPQMEIKL